MSPGAAAGAVLRNADVRILPQTDLDMTGSSRRVTAGNKNTEPSPCAAPAMPEAPSSARLVLDTELAGCRKSVLEAA